jgi:hypothetical protein
LWSGALDAEKRTFASRKTRSIAGTATRPGFVTGEVGADAFHLSRKLTARWEIVAVNVFGIGNRGRVETEVFADGPTGPIVVLFGDGVVQQELGFALGGVDFDGHGDGGAEEDAVFALFRDEEVAFF